MRLMKIIEDNLRSSLVAKEAEEIASRLYGLHAMAVKLPGEYKAGTPLSALTPAPVLGRTEHENLTIWGNNQHYLSVNAGPRPASGAFWALVSSVSASTKLGD